MTANMLIAYVDVDDTLIRSSGAKRIPMSSVVDHVRELHRRGVILYCWSSGGAEYAQTSARELGLDACFSGFLPKPNVLIDDQAPAAWHRFVCVPPNEAVSKTLDDYAAILNARPREPRE
jgi:rhodanese-related sulfurtransferase